MSKADDNLFLIAAVLGVGVIAYLAFSNSASASPSASGTGTAPAPASGSATNADWGALDPSSW